MGKRVAINSSENDEETPSKKPGGGLMSKLFGGDKAGGGVAKLSNAIRRTVVVKDLRIYKEKEKQRRSELIYGTTDMKTKLFERAQKEKKQRRQKDMNEISKDKDKD